MYKHTTGPWRFNDNVRYEWKTNPFSITTRKPGVNSTTIANMPYRKTISQEEAMANARLISAAPDLLDALMTFPQSMAWTDDDLWKWSEKARAAIDKALGNNSNKN